MNNFEELDESRKIDVLRAKHELLSKSIDSATRALSLLENNKEQLEKRFEEINQEVEALDEENKKYSSVQIQIPHYSEASKKLEFFDQLKLIEAETEIFNVQVAVYQQNINTLTNEFSNTAQKKKRLIAKISELKNTLSTATDTMRERKAAETQLKLQIQNESSEIVALQDLCIKIKEDIVKQANEMKDITPEAMQQLVLQKDALVDVVRKAKAEKTELETKLKQEESNYSAKENIATKKLVKEASPLVWMAERNTLMIKIRKAREELQQLEIRSRSAEKSKQRTDSKKEEINLNEEAVKKALFLEKNAVESTDTSFIDNAIETEEAYQKELQQKLAEIDQTRAQIDGFKTNMMDLMHQQDEIAASADRIELLKQELNEIRSKL